MSSGYECNINKVIIIIKNYAVRPERLNNEPERMEEYLNFKKGSTQKAFAEHLKSKKILRKTPSYTTKEMTHEPEAE